MAPMEKNLCTADGVVTAALHRLSRGAGARPTSPCSASRPPTSTRSARDGRFSSARTPTPSSPLSRDSSAAVHAAGGRISFELAHCGRQTNSVITGRQPVAPSAVPCVASGGYVPRPLTTGEIAEIVERFAAAASRAKAAGVDAIEIHGASGYLINAFTSPYTNLRDDEYGGSPERRMRFPLEVVAAVRRAVGLQMPLLYRMSADDCVPGGITPALERTAGRRVGARRGRPDRRQRRYLRVDPRDAAADGGAAGPTPVLGRDDQAPRIDPGRDRRQARPSRGGRARAGSRDKSTLSRSAGGSTPTRSCSPKHNRAGSMRFDVASRAPNALPSWAKTNPPTARSIRRRSESGRLRPRRAAISKDVLIVGGGPAGLEAARGAACAATTSRCSNDPTRWAARSGSERSAPAGRTSPSRCGFSNAN